jgi:hypothetical protein
MSWATKEFWFDFQQGQNILLQSIQTASEAQPASYSVTIGGSFPMGKGQCSWGMHLTTHVCQVLRLRMSGAIPPSPICLMACTGTTLPPLPLLYSVRSSLFPVDHSRQRQTERECKSKRVHACVHMWGEGGGMGEFKYNWQFCVLQSVSSSSFYRRVKLVTEPWCAINFLGLFPLHSVISSTVLEKFNREQKNHHPKENHFRAEKAIIFL